MHHAKPSGPQLYGVIAEYADGEAVVAAAKAARVAGYTKLDAYTPYMVEDLADALGTKDDRIPMLVTVMGLIGAGSGFLMQWWINNIDFPMNIGGRPNTSWPSFIPITFESGVLVAALTAAIGMLVLNGLPRPHHPIFDAPGIERATKDKFFLCIEAADPEFQLEKARQVLASTNPESISEVHS